MKIKNKIIHVAHLMVAPPSPMSPALLLLSCPFVDVYSQRNTYITLTCAKIRRRFTMSRRKINVKSLLRQMAIAWVRSWIVNRGFNRQTRYLIMLNFNNWKTIMLDVAYRSSHYRALRALFAETVLHSNQQKNSKRGAKIYIYIYIYEHRRGDYIARKFQ